MSKYFNVDDAYDSGTLHNWYIDSVSENDTPKWTEQHLDELERDFYIFPKDTKPTDVAPVVHAHWEHKGWFDNECSICHSHYPATYKYCPNCGAKMDESEDKE